ncbi:hypothetical protein ACMAY7_05025 [Rhodobacteraceae bacterium nBUS_24]|jgi:hypothetical protein
MLNFKTIIFGTFFSLLANVTFSETFLYMAEEDGCFWCASWTSKVGSIYHKTKEGKVAPLRRFNMHREIPETVEFVSRISFSPTFILVQNNKEVGRIEGYPGEDHFWGLLGIAFANAQIILDKTD